MFAYVLPLLLLVAPAQAASPAGGYRLVGSPDTASAIILQDDGRFDFVLAEGALDLSASGRWTSEGGRVLLTPMPKPVPPEFSLAGIARRRDAGLAIKVVAPGGRGLAGVDFRIALADGSTITGYTQEDGWSSPDRRHPLTIQLAIPMFDLASPPFRVDGAAGNAFTFLLTPNDIGRVDFQAAPLEIGSDRLVLRRDGRELVYVREAPDPPPE
jgi:hypothetical protein